MDRWLLNLDSSTQSLTAVAVAPASRRVVIARSLRFDAELPQYGTRNGVLRSADPTVVHAPPLMWAEALDRMLARLRAEGLDLGAIAAIAVFGQQHGSVGLTRGAADALARLHEAPDLAIALRGVLSRSTSPVWNGFPPPNAPRSRRLSAKRPRSRRRFSPAGSRRSIPAMARG